MKGGESNRVAENMTISNSQLGPPRGTQLTWKFWQQRRYILVVLAFLGFINAYALRVNLSVAIVAMTEPRNVTLDDGTVVEKAEFDWDSKQQGLVLSSFFYGYICTQILGGIIASKIGGHYVFGLGIGVTAVMTLLTPLAAKFNIYVLVAVRIIEGLFEGITFPCMHAIFSRWAPMYERSRMASFAFSGSYFGTVVSLPLSSLLAVNWGWESVFYCFGALGCAWCVAWLAIIKPGPETDPYISEAEKTYILSSIGSNEKQKIKHPWKDIVTSTAVWAIVASHFAENWGFYTLMTQLPAFLIDTLGFDLGESGFLSAVPYLAMTCLLAVGGYLADWTQVKGYLTTGQVRRYFNCGSFLAQTTFMMLAAFLLHPVWSVVSITLAVGLGAFAICGYMVNPLDLAPNHASVIFGLSNTVATIPGIVSPLLTGIIVTNKTNSEWQIVFYISASIYLLGAFVYWFLCRGELQPWAQTFPTDQQVQPSAASAGKEAEKTV
ncbi:sialin-like [Phlebotomus argentipes]|uniref:sialin-like n=1 Tax=Phlebotomus argentipes TaxID=94469 RepID=UPI002893331E|nr:sialin-like [Phlebotomus argentipes]